MATVLLIVSAVTILLAVVSVLGAGVDVLSFGSFAATDVLLPLVGVASGVAGILLFTGSPGLVAGIAAAISAIVVLAVLVPILWVLSRSSKESVPTDFVGKQAVVINPISPGFRGTVEVKTDTGHYLLSAVADVDLPVDSIVYLSTALDDDTWLVTSFQ